MKKGYSKISFFYKKYESFINILLLIILPLVVFYNSLNIFYSDSDDLNATVHTKRNIAEAFVTNTLGGMDGGDYRPIEVISHQMDRYFYGDFNVAGRHATNLIVHVLNVILIYFLGLILTKRKVIGLLAGLIFAIYFTNSLTPSPVVWISGRVDSFVTLFYLLTLILFIKSIEKNSNFIYFLSLFFYVLALMSKEMAATLPFIILLYSFLFPIQKEGKGIFHSENLYKLLLTVASIGVIFVLIGVSFSPKFLAPLLSKDGIFQNPTIERINFDRIILLLSGGIIISSIILIFLLTKFSPKVYKFLLVYRYSISYFLVLFFYLSARFIFLGGFGGCYATTSGTNLFFQLRPDSFIRDLYALSGLIWPVNDNYLNFIFILQQRDPFLFYLLGVAAVTFLFFLIIWLHKSRSKVLIFGLGWIFITLIPLHDILIVNGTFQARYLYLPLVGFSIFLSIIVYKIKHFDKIPFHITKAAIVCIVLFALLVNSIMIIDNNKKLHDSGQKMKSFILDLKDQRISNESKIYFVNFPTSIYNINSLPSSYKYEELQSGILNYVLDPQTRFTDKLKMRLNNILNFSDAAGEYRKHFAYEIILFTNTEEKNDIQIRWIDQRNFILEGIELKNYSALVNKNADKNIEYAAKQRETLLQSFSKEGEIKQTDNAVLQILKLDKENDLANLKVTLKNNTDQSKGEDVFLLFNKNHLEMVGDFSKSEDNNLSQLTN